MLPAALISPDPREALLLNQREQLFVAKTIPPVKLFELIRYTSGLLVFSNEMVNPPLICPPKIRFLLLEWTRNPEPVIFPLAAVVKLVPPITFVIELELANINLPLLVTVVSVIVPFSNLKPAPLLISIAPTVLIPLNRFVPFIDTSFPLVPLTPFQY